MTTEEVYEAIRAERARQDSKFKTQAGEWKSTAHRKLTVLMEEVGEIARAILEGDTENLRTEIVQVAAVSVKWLESFDSTEGL